MTEVLLLGGYGNFGKRIAQGLSQRGVPVIIAGRDLMKAKGLADTLTNARAARIDIHHGLEDALNALKPSVVIHTCGPFQGSDYAVARTALRAGCHYIDLADGRDFVRDFASLDTEAKTAGVSLISGASTVPGLSSAVLAHFRPQFQHIDALDFGISPGQKAERGLATTRAIMSYVGKPLRPFAGHPRSFGWQDARRLTYPVMGKRWLANCDIPDLDLLPPAYGLSNIRFGAGLELATLHLGLWATSWLIRLSEKLGATIPLERLAKPLLTIANGFNGFGSDTGGMHMILRGQGHDGQALEKRWFIIAETGDGPQIPCVPAILLAQRLHEKDPGLQAGAYPCVGLVRLEDYLDALKPFAIRVF